MPFPTRLVGVLLGAAVAAPLALPVAASANAGDKTITQTYPAATALCARTTAGTENKRLKAHSTEVLADCSALSAEFAAAQTTLTTARTTIGAQIASLRAATATACPTENDQAAACVTARKSNHAAIMTLGHQRVVAIHTYYKTVEAGRQAFWKAIHALPGAHRISSDSPIQVQSR